MELVGLDGPRRFYLSQIDSRILIIHWVGFDPPEAEDGCFLLSLSCPPSAIYSVKNE